MIPVELPKFLITKILCVNADLPKFFENWVFIKSKHNSNQKTLQTTLKGKIIQEEYT